MIQCRLPKDSIAFTATYLCETLAAAGLAVAKRNRAEAAVIALARRSDVLAFIAVALETTVREPPTALRPPAVRRTGVPTLTTGERANTDCISRVGGMVKCVGRDEMGCRLLVAFDLKNLTDNWGPLGEKGFNNRQ